MSSSPVTSPTQSPAPSPVTSLSNVCTGLSPLPVLTQFPRPGGPAQGKGSVRWAAVSCQIHPLHPIPKWGDQEGSNRQRITVAGHSVRRSQLFL